MFVYIAYIVGGLITIRFINSLFPPLFFQKDDIFDCVAITILFLMWPLLIVFLIFICPILYIIGRLLIEMFER